MSFRFYRDSLKPLTKRLGLHSYLRWLHDRTSLGNFVTVHDRESLRHMATTVYDYSRSETVRLPAPAQDSPAVVRTAIATLEERYTFAQPFVAEIRGGKLLPHMGVCATPSYGLLLDSANSRERRIRGFLTYHPRLAARLLWKQRRSQKTVTGDETTDLECAVSFVRPRDPVDLTRSKDQYSHWLRSYLPRLEGIQAYQQHTGISPSIILEADPPSWVVESLEYFGFGEQIVYWSRDQELTVERLLVPSVRRVEQLGDKSSQDFKLLSPAAVRWLRDSAHRNGDTQEDTAQTRIFISRTDAERRHLANHDDIEAYLETQGFESYELSTLSFAEQVALFQRADIVVGVHGAGLTNLVFAADCRVYEIIGDVYKPTYYLLAHVLDLEYAVIQGESIPVEGESVLHQDIQLDLEGLASALEN